MCMCKYRYIGKIQSQLCMHIYKINIHNSIVITVYILIKAFNIATERPLLEVILQCGSV